MRVEDFPMALRMLRTNPRSQEELARLYLAEFAKYQALAAVTSRLSRELAFDPGDFDTLEKQYKVARSAELAQLRKYSDIFDLLTQETKDKYLRARVSARRNPKEFVIYHADHGISPEQMEWIKSQIIAANPKTFFIQEIQIPAELGSVRNAMYGPAAGDPPVPESEVSYRPRGDRPWSDRVVSWPTRPVDYVQAIGTPDQNNPNKIVLFTVYGGPLAPQHPDDPGCRDVPAAKKFWSQHALSLEQWS